MMDGVLANAVAQMAPPASPRSIKGAAPGDRADAARAAAQEFEAVFRHRLNHSDHLWIVAVGRGSDRRWDQPPEAEEYPAEVRERITVRGSEVWFAALSEKLGAWEAFWEEKGVMIAAWFGTSLEMNGDSIRDLLGSVVVRV